LQTGLLRSRAGKLTDRTRMRKEVQKQHDN
jgi:hypothetical protein